MPIPRSTRPLRALSAVRRPRSSPDLGIYGAGAFAAIEFNWIYYQQQSGAAAAPDPSAAADVPPHLRPQVEAAIAGASDPTLARTRFRSILRPQQPDHEVIRR